MPGSIACFVPRPMFDNKDVQISSVGLPWSNNPE
jgi:hypothetical protein